MRFLFRPAAKMFLRGIFLGLAATSAILAQDSHGALLVVVQDASSGRIAGAGVTLSEEKFALKRTAKADARGEARFDTLQPGTYSVSVSADGFNEKNTKVVVAVSSQPTFVLTLAPQTVQQSVQVRDRGPSLASQPLETTSNTVQTIITAEDLDEIPLSARSFANIALLAPFTVPVEPSDPTKARITAISFGGSSGLNVDLSVDGGDNNDDYIGGFLQNYSPEAIQEFVVRTAQFSADTSRTNGGSVILSTRRGGDDWHGSLSYYYRGKNLNARNTLDNPEPNPKQPFARQNGVATFGGPLKREKLWFFSSFEYVDENASVAYSANSLRQFNALAQLASAGLLPGVSALDSIPTSVPVPFRGTLSSTRLDWTQSSRSQWFVRGSLDRTHSQNELLQQGTLPLTGAKIASNYYSILLNNQFRFNSAWRGSFIGQASGFHHTKVRNSNLGLALRFPFSATFLTTSGLDTFGDNQFQTSITAFPIARDQQKYQFRYDLARSAGSHTTRFGVNLIHEPVLRGAFSGNPETLTVYPQDPSFYIADANISILPRCAREEIPDPTPVCPASTTSGRSDGTFSQSVRRLGFYAEDSWRVTRASTLNAGLRYDTTFGLFIASGRDQSQNPALTALLAVGSNLVPGIPHDYRQAFAPRLGFAYAPHGSATTVIRAGAGLYYNDLAQNGWAKAFIAVNSFNLLKGSSPSALIDPNYHTPYALTASAGLEHVFDRNWRLSITYEHQQGVHQYRRYEYVPGIGLPGVPATPSISLFRSDNRSIFDGLAVQVQHSFSRRFELTANYVLGHATTWGATVGELFDYVNGVSNVLNPFGPGDHGPSGEDIRHRLVIVGVLQLPWKLEASSISQFESARPYTMSTPLDVNHDTVLNDRAVVNGVQTSLDQFRGTPFYQVDLRVSRNILLRERFTLCPFAEFFNLFNRPNPGNNFVSDIAALPTPVNSISNATAICLDASCAQSRPITSLDQLRVSAGALGDFFGPGTTVGIPFAAQLGIKLTF
ncbi:MAG TPA: carboxypeptidase regulatory-like domain-containing protein [Candidatus Dormibacteraeota bacterium]|nr:carboxypeptidase regulatory-like domain-containing protein [Candidatus Dormibacteraeota bacterium]